MQNPSSLRLLVALLLALGSGLPAAAQTASGRSGTISGRVSSTETGAPLVGVLVEAATLRGQTLASAITDVAGQYRIDQLAPGGYVLHFSALGFEPRREESVRVHGGRATTVDAELATRAIQLGSVVVSASRRPERALDAPARVEVVGAREIEERPALTPAEHLRGLQGVDIVTTGVQSSNVVARGFNSIFSGALLALTDHRIAGVPSLRVNLLHMVPATSEDLERMEVVLGPGSALYGPNTANGVLHIFTRSPLTEPGTVVSLAAGDQRLLLPAFRTAHRFGESFGIKLSGEYLRAREWAHEDATERTERAFADAAPEFWRQRIIAAEGIGAEEAQQRFERIARREEVVERVSAEARADWQVAPGVSAIFAAGMTSAIHGVELTGLGAAQVEDWRYAYYQARASWNRLFAQLYLNTSDAGQTYLLRNGSPIVDLSRLLVAQVQHGTTLGARQNLTYGIDYIFTNPRTGGTIHGRHEGEDDMRELGAFVQSETALTPRLDLVLAGRIDTHSHLPEPVLSPRAALVYRPAAHQSVRLTYNRAFSTPAAINLFLDLGTPFPSEAALLSQLGYSVRVQGTLDGIRVRAPEGAWQMRSPIAHPTYNPDPGALITPHSGMMWQQAAGVLRALERLDAQTHALLLALTPPATLIGVNAWDVATNRRVALESLDIPDVPQIRESNANTLELGYTGTLGARLRLAADLWYSRRDSFVTPLMLQTPFLQLDSAGVHGYLQPILGPDAAAQLAGGMAQLPLGVISSEEVYAQGAQALMTYRNFGEIQLWGSDLSATALFGERLSLSVIGSFVSRDHFFSDEQLITLNAPGRKGAISFGYHRAGPEGGFNAEARLRYTAGFPAASGVYFGTDCVVGAPQALAGPCVQSHTLADLTLGHRPPGERAPSIQLTVQNLLDRPYQSFPGVPTIGRMALLRLKYEF